MGHTSHSAIVLALFIITFTSGEISPKIKKLEYIYDKASNRKIGYIVTRVQPMNSKFSHENIDRNETSFIKFSTAKKIGRVKENGRIDRTDGNQANKDDNYHEDQQAEAGNNEEILAQHLREDLVKTLTIVKKVPVPFPVENTVHYPVIKNIPYMVKVPVPEPYAVERKIPVPVKVFVKVPVKIPKPVPVIKQTPYAVHVPVERPVPIKVFIPNPYPVEKKIPYEVKVPVPQPFPVERKIPVPVKFTENVPQPYPVEKVVHYPIKIQVQRPVPVPVLQPYAVHVTKNVPYFVDKHVPVPVKVEVEKPVPYPVEKPVPVPIEDYGHGDDDDGHDHIPQVHEHN